MTRSFPLAAASAAVAAVVLVATAGAAAASPPAHAHPAEGEPGPLGHFKHLVVIYEENHSFDNLYGQWGTVNGQAVEGLAANPAATPRATQVREDGTPYKCLDQNDKSLSTPPLDAACGQDSGSNGTQFTSHFTNAPFDINSYITPQSTTCTDPTTKAPAPGGCTRDLVHRFYQEQYQLDGGKMDRYTTGSDAVGLTQGYYDTAQLPVFQYLHDRGAPKYVVADHFFQAAFGGSFLNHQYLIAAQAPVWPGAPAGKHSVVDANGMPTNYPLYTSPQTTVTDQPVTQACGTATTQTRFACGDFAVNTVQPAYTPTAGGSNQLPAINDVDPKQPNYEPNIGDRLSAKGVPWAWYSGGWDAANSGHPDPLFQYHHQPFNYFQAYAPGTQARADHLKDETAFMSAAKAGTLPAVSFVKPSGAENEHPGYASTSNGEQHLVDLLKAVQNGKSAGDTLVVVTYDEFGGAWDHVTPPGQGGTKGTSDQFGPGTRIPALVISRSLPRSGVDHTVYDTTSILATIEHQYGLAPLSNRDAAVSDLRPALVAAGGRHSED